MQNFTVIFQKYCNEFFNTKVALILTALIKLQQLVRPPLSKTVQFIFRKSDPSNFRVILKDVRTRGIYSIIIDTRPESLPHLLTAVSILVLIAY